MKLLWAKSDFLHPTTRGGQIRTLEILKRLHQRHEVHYVALQTPGETEGVRRSSEYCLRAYPIPHYVPSHRSPRFALQLAAGLFSSIPVAVGRYRSTAMRACIGDLLAGERFDAIVCDFLVPSINMDGLERAVLFQHNVETIIWQRHVEHASDPVRRWYLELQARRMFEYEREVCRRVRRIIAVSATDAQAMENMFGVSDIAISPTGVDADYFAQRDGEGHRYDLVFVGSMDWLPNTDGIRFFYEEILPLIRRKRPDCSVAIVGRNAPPEIAQLAKEPGITITGTVPDVRPYLWRSRASIVPLRIGGGTRLKIYEAMAAGTPVVSTPVGAEGLDVSHPANIRLAATPEAFAVECLRLLESEHERKEVSAAALELVRSRFSWDRVCRDFENAAFG